MGFITAFTSDTVDTEFEFTCRGLEKVLIITMDIEDTFKISKSEFDSRPVFVRTNDHIDAHFTTRFTALVLIRLLQTKLDNNFPVGKIIHALKSYCCIPIDTNTY